MTGFPRPTEPPSPTDTASDWATEARRIKIASIAALGAVAVLVIVGLVTSGGGDRERNPDPALAAAQTVYTAWRAGDPASASSVVVGSVVEDLRNARWTPGIDPPTQCDPPRGTVHEFSCVSYDHDRGVRIFLVKHVAGKWVVDLTAECSGIRPHVTCWWYEIAPDGTAPGSP